MRLWTRSPEVTTWPDVCVRRSKVLQERTESWKRIGVNENWLAEDDVTFVDCAPVSIFFGQKTNGIEKKRREVTRRLTRADFSLTLFQSPAVKRKSDKRLV